MLLAVSLAGCFGGGDTPDEDDDDDDTFPWQGRPDRDDRGNASMGLAVTLTDVPVNGTFGTAFNISWEIDLLGPDDQADDQADNATGANRTVNETGLAWDFVSDIDPREIADYGNHSAAARNTTAPGAWNMSVVVNATEEDNATQNATVLYLRAYAIGDNGTLYWSNEVEIELEPERLPQTATVAIVGSGLLAEYDPAEITIQVGDSVVWTNNDTLELSHTATYRSGPVEFDTGNIAAGEASAPIVFDTPGTYTYACDNHGTMDEATIIVTAANETT